MASAEVEGFSKTGGLADAVRSLALHLAFRGHEVRLLTPAYNSVPGKNNAAVALPDLSVPMGNGPVRCRVLLSSLKGSTRSENVSIPVYLLEHDGYFSRDGFYGNEDGDFEDNAERFGFFSKSAFHLCEALDWVPDVFHAHDWHTALLPYYLSRLQKNESRFSNSTAVFTIHNAGYQGHVAAANRKLLGIPESDFHQDLFEDHNRLNLLKGGIVHAHRVNTVSPGYAEELLTPLGGHGLHEFYLRRGEAFSGILNGCAYSEWNPGADKHLPAVYDAGNLDGKAKCKSKLQQSVGLPDSPQTPLLGMVSRLTSQKGFAFLLPAAAEFMEFDLQCVLLGTGEEWIARELRNLNRRFGEKFIFLDRYDNAMAHLIEGGSDIYLMPSLYEPCGLNQIYSLRYGSLPVVRAVGGLKDTVVDFDDPSGSGTGFVFNDPAADKLTACVRRAVYAFNEQPVVFEKTIHRAMKKRFSWETAVLQYEKLFRNALAEVRNETPFPRKVDKS